MEQSLPNRHSDDLERSAELIVSGITTLGSTSIEAVVVLKPVVCTVNSEPNLLDLPLFGTHDASRVFESHRFPF